MKHFFLSLALLAAMGQQAQIDLTSNLKVCMPFKGNANDLSGNALNGTVSSVTLTTDRFGVPGNAYQFDRNNDSHIAINSFLTIAPTNELTIAMWAKADIVTSNCLFVLFPDNSNDRCVGCAQYVSSPTMMVWDYGNIYTNGRVLVQNIPADVTNWHHYTFVVSQLGNLKQTYLDGVVNSNGPYGGTVLNKAKQFYIGGDYSDGSNGKIMWTGKIDDVCIYNRALTANEVLALYTATAICSSPTPTTPPTGTLVTTETLVIPGTTLTTGTTTETITGTGLTELQKAERLIVYPSVSSGIFQVINGGEEAAIEVYRFNGEKLMAFKLDGQRQAIDLSEFPSGIYLVQMYSRNRRITQRIIRE